MARCEQCGNDYDKSFEVSMGGRTMIFDSFECAIQALAPTCPHCGVRIVGHGVEHEGTVYCCAHCARQGGASRASATGIEVSAHFLVIARLTGRSSNPCGRVKRTAVATGCPLSRA